MLKEAAEWLEREAALENLIENFGSAAPPSTAPKGKGKRKAVRQPKAKPKPKRNHADKGARTAKRAPVCQGSRKRGRPKADPETTPPQSKRHGKKTSPVETRAPPLMPSRLGSAAASPAEGSVAAAVAAAVAAVERTKRGRIITPSKRLEIYEQERTVARTPRTLCAPGPAAGTGPAAAAIGVAVATFQDERRQILGTGQIKASAKRGRTNGVQRILRTAADHGLTPAATPKAAEPGTSPAQRTCGEVTSGRTPPDKGPAKGVARGKGLGNNIVGSVPRSAPKAARAGKNNRVAGVTVTAKPPALRGRGAPLPRKSGVHAPAARAQPRPDGRGPASGTSGAGSQGAGAETVIVEGAETVATEPAYVGLCERVLLRRAAMGVAKIMTGNAKSAPSQTSGNSFTLK